MEAFKSPQGQVKDEQAVACQAALLQSFRQFGKRLNVISRETMLFAHPVISLCVQACPGIFVTSSSLRMSLAPEKVIRDLKSCRIDGMSICLTAMAVCSM